MAAAKKGAGRERAAGRDRGGAGKPGARSAASASPGASAGAGKASTTKRAKDSKASAGKAAGNAGAKRPAAKRATSPKTTTRQAKRAGPEAAAQGASFGSQPERREVVVVGSGFSGLCMAIRLRNAGIHDFVVLEKADDIGGTWRDNLYPGCACDVPSYLYSFSFEQNPNWSRMFAPQQEIWDYLKHCARKYQVLPHLRFKEEVRSATFDEAAREWHVTTSSGSRYITRVLVSGIGALSIPATPKLPGAERFSGTRFHSARWPQGIDLRGKRVAVIGTGASAIQFVPEIAPDVAHMVIFQRTPPWIMSKPDRRISRLEQRMYRYLPPAQRLMRSSIYWWMESRVLGLAVDPRAMRLAELMARRHIRRSIKDPELRAKVTPDYTIGCKRILMSDDYYPALARSNVEVNTDGVREVGSDVITDGAGRQHAVDTIIYGTGFQVSDPIGPMSIVGVGGREIRETWKEGGMEAYLGISVAGFPNFFMLLGPNTGLGHSSIIFMIESQVEYVLQAIHRIRKSPQQALDVKPAAQRAFNEGLQAQLDKAVWSSGGCNSWYLDEFGKNRTLWPSFTFRYWMRTRRFEKSKYATV